MRRGLLVLALGLLLWATPVVAQRGPPSARSSPPDPAAEMARTIQVYRDAVARSVPLH